MSRASMNIKKKPGFKEEFSLDRLYDNAVKMEAETEPQAPKIRMSSFPFCPKKFLFNCLESIDGGLWSFTGDFYCDIGTAVHSALQKWMPLANPGTILGNWSCDACGKWVKDKNPSNPKGRIWKPYVVKALVGPINCPKCGQPMKYEEFEFMLPEAPASGHCDGILLYDPSSVLNMKLTDNYYVLDKILRDPDFGKKIPAYILEYKTSGLNVLSQRSKPKNEHQCQATMYVSAARRILPQKYGLVNLDVRGFIIKYIARDRPQARSQDLKYEIDSDDTFYMRQCEMVNIFDKAVMTRDIKYMKAMYKCFPCKEIPDIYNDCPYFTDCEAVTAKEFKSLVKKAKEVYEKSRVGDKHV